MSESYRALAFSPDVFDAQVAYGSRLAWERHDRTGHGPGAGPTEPDDGPERLNARDPLTDDERDFIAGMDGFYLATVSETGWPYVQFRGGPPGFVTTPDRHTIAWPDFRGNRQYISAGHLAHDNRSAIIFMDYSRQARLKVYGRASMSDLRSTPRSDISEAVGHYPAKVEREVRIDVSAYDWNCPQHITPRFSAEEFEPLLAPLRARVAELEAENARLRDGQWSDTGAGMNGP